MHSFRTQMLLVFVLIQACGLTARADTFQDFVDTIQQVNQVFESNYALYDVKNDRFDWSSSSETEQLIAKAKSLPNLSIHDAQNFLIRPVTITRKRFFQANP